MPWWYNSVQSLLLPLTIEYWLCVSCWVEYPIITLLRHEVLHMSNRGICSQALIKIISISSSSKLDLVQALSTTEPKARIIRSAIWWVSIVTWPPDSKWSVILGPWRRCRNSASPCTVSALHFRNISKTSTESQDRALTTTARDFGPPAERYSSIYRAFGLREGLA